MANLDLIPSNLPKLSISKAIKLLRLTASKINKSGKQGIFLWGPPGIGKSDLVKELAILTQRKFVDIRLSTIDPVDLRGLPSINSAELITKWLPPNFLPKHDSDPGILFMDEINAAPPSVQAAAYQLILDRRIGDYVVPEDWILIAAGNRISDRSITFRLPTALSNRFTHLEIVVSNQEWYEWAWKNDIDPYIISFLRYQPQLLNTFDPNLDDLAFATPRSWSFVSNFQEVRKQDINLYAKAVKGTIGEAVTQQFIAFLAYKDELPDPETILMGDNYEEPKLPDAQFVMLAALINAIKNEITQERISNFFKFVNKYSRGRYADYSVILVKELINVINQLDKDNKTQFSKMLLEHSSYKKWVNDNIDLLS